MRCTILIFLFGLACNLLAQPLEFQSWKSPKGETQLTLFINSVNGSPIKNNLSNQAIGTAILSKNNQGFVTIQIPISNLSRFRKIFRVSWQWVNNNGMIAMNPSDSALSVINISGKGQEVLEATSSIANPKSVILTFYPKK